jgi:hypothetical protein
VAGLRRGRGSTKDETQTIEGGLGAANRESGVAMAVTRIEMVQGGPQSSKWE